MGGWVGGWVVKRDFITHSGSSEHSLDSESKFEPSVAIIISDNIQRNTCLAALGALFHRLQQLNNCKIENACQCMTVTNYS